MHVSHSDAGLLRGARHGRTRTGKWPRFEISATMRERCAPTTPPPHPLQLGGWVRDSFLPSPPARAPAVFPRPTPALPAFSLLQTALWLRSEGIVAHLGHIAWFDILLAILIYPRGPRSNATERYRTLSNALQRCLTLCNAI